jgi:poly(3-hydroxybutyrate) depolymerase
MTMKFNGFIAFASLFLLTVSSAMSAGGRLWTTREGQSGLGTFVSVTPEGELVLQNDQGREFRIEVLHLCTNDLAYLCSENLLGSPREWTLRSGKITKAHFVALKKSGVLLITPAGVAGVVALDQLSDNDVAWLELEAPIPVERRIAGEWSGFLQTGDVTCHTTVKITPNGNSWKGSANLWAQISTNRSSMTKAVSAENYRRSFMAKSTFNVAVTNGVMTMSKFNTTISARGKEWPANWELTSFTGALTNSGVWVATGGANCDKDSRTWWLARAPLYRFHPPLAVKKGEVLTMTCSEPRLHYRLYVPNSYDPTVPTPLLVNDSPGKNASPLSTRMAEELGWIMVGLTESGNDAKSSLEWVGNNAAVIFDLMRMFNLDTRRFYFSGFSGGARRSAYRAVEFQDYCAGVLCIGAGYFYYQDGVYIVPPKALPIFYITGQTDMNHNEVAKTMMEPDKKCGRLCKVLIHPGGHEWGRPEDHETALKWLDAQWNSAHPKKVKSGSTL